LADLDAHRGRRVLRRPRARREGAHLGADPRRGERALDALHRRTHRRTPRAERLGSRTASLGDEGGGGMTKQLCVAALCVAAVVAAGCGGGNKSSSVGGSTGAPTGKAKTGGNLTVLYNSDVDFIDPGVTYALERGYNPNDAGEYLAYFADVKGAAAATKGAKPGKTPNIAGIETPGRSTIRFQLERPRAAIVVGALSLPASAPVPRDYAEKYDKQKPSQYGSHQVATGPYMIQNNGKANASGYSPGKFIKLVRNPSWKRSTDYKPAYLDSITIEEGVDPDVGSRRILNGQGMANGDFQLPPQIIKTVSTGTKKKQLVVTPPTGRFRYIAFDVRKK